MRTRSIPAEPCVRACQQASLRLDGELSELESALLAEHLERCPDCRATAEGMVEVAALLRAAQLSEPAFSIRVPPRRRVARDYALQALSTAAVAAVAVTGLVGLRLSAGLPPRADLASTRALMGLKEHQLGKLEAPPARSRSARGVEAAAGTTLGGPAPPSARGAIPYSLPSRAGEGGTQA